MSEATVDTSASGLDGQPLKVAIIGKAPSSVGLAPYDDPAWDIWILNTLGYNKEVPRWDRQFELHDLELTKDKAYGGYYDWLRQQDRPVYTRDGCDEFKNSIKYPYDRVFQFFDGMVGKKYFTNTVSWMIALAILEGAKEIGLYGVDMAQHGVGLKSEYAHQRPSCEYWIGVAEGRGIKVHLPEQSDLLKTAALYGFHTDDLWRKAEARRKELTVRIQNAQAIEQQKHDEAVYLSGALDGMNYHTQWLGGAGK